MKCVICHSEQFVYKTVQEELKINTDIILVPIDANVCQTCGERYYSRQAMKGIESIEQQIIRLEKPLKVIGKVLLCEG